MIDIQHLRQWIGKTTGWSGQITPEPYACMAATLGRPELLNRKIPSLPPLWHWLYGLPVLEPSRLRADGMPLESDILPPVPLPGRMWAASALRFRHDLCIGDMVHRQSRIADITHKQGRSGDLVFVELAHTLTSPRGLALEERHTIAFRDLERKRPAPAQGGEQAGAARTQASEQKPAPKPDFSQEVAPNEILLFRYSALTFNSHRIHYDRAYATQTEGYPGLVVHGPLIATLLLDLVTRRCPGRRVHSFSFKALNPIFDLHPFHLHMRRDSAYGKPFTAWATDHAGKVCMQAEGEFG